MAHKSAARISDHAKHESHDMVHDVVDAVTGYAKQGYDTVAEKGQQVKDTTEHYITGNPWYAVGIALGVGVLLGLSLRGRRD
jgi:ElaB/YqjD/DUF883 family membrane-anchored ribosome-binding protein